MEKAYHVEVSVEKFSSRDGKTSWTALARAWRRFGIRGDWNTADRGVEVTVHPGRKVAFVSGRGRVAIGEPWPDPTTPVGLARLLAIAERLAVTAWERRYGGGK